MNKLLNFVKKHLISSIAILVGATTLVVVGVSFLATYINYTQYSKNYDEMKEELLVNTPRPPEKVVKDNEFVVYDNTNKTVTSSKSTYPNTYVLTARDAVIDLDEGSPAYATISGTSWEAATGFKKGGSITFSIDTATNGMSDIVVYLGMGEVKNVTIDNLIDYITIKVNGLSVNTVDFALPSDGSLQQLVLKETKLIAGENTLEFATSVSDNNNFIMPAIAAVTFFTDAELAQ